MLIGLLHNIGTIILLQVTHTQMAAPIFDIDDDEFEAICFEWHQEFGNFIAETWQLPDDLKALIADHHRYPDADEPLCVERIQLVLTDMICSRLEYTPHQPYDLLGCLAAHDLGLTDNPAFQRFLDGLPNELEDAFASL